MAECDSCEDVLVDISDFNQTDCPLDQVSSVFYDRTRETLRVNPGGAVRVSESSETLVPEVETDGSEELDLLLPRPTGSISSGGCRVKRIRRNRRLTSLESESFASSGKTCCIKRGLRLNCVTSALKRTVSVLLNSKV